MTVTINKRVLGNALGFDIDGTDYWSDMGSFELAPSDDDKDVLTFADAAGGATSGWTLKGKSIISFDNTSFWEKVWGAFGKEVPFVIAPLGNKTASVGKPHFKGKVKISSRPPISSEAGEEKGATFEFEWKVVGDVEKVTTGSTLGRGAMEETTGA
ncbi:hypothetical protein [Schaalia sp. ZJ1691]|uniref:hypothetical protein n=1 Tax=Schaalia sp. ZJ1691 TaxID=2709404 RepID=UPI0013E9D15E|nr:hypothetical protein [Schaalia sp. ZJ1691]